MKTKCLTIENVDDLLQCVLVFGILIIFFIFISIFYTMKSIEISQKQISIIKDLKKSQEETCRTISTLNDENMMTIKNLANENFFKTSTIIELLKSIKACLDRLFWFKPIDMKHGSTIRFH